MTADAIINKSITTLFTSISMAYNARLYLSLALLSDVCFGCCIEARFSARYTDFVTVPLCDLVSVVLYQTAEVRERDAYAVNVGIARVFLVLLYRVT